MSLNNNHIEMSNIDKCDSQSHHLPLAIGYWLLAIGYWLLVERGSSKICGLPELCLLYLFTFNY